MNAQELNAVLPQFTGTENYYYHSKFLVLTDGVKFLADNAGAYWLMDIISSVMYKPTILREPFLTVNVKKNKTGKGAVVRIQNGDGKDFYVQRIKWTDFPMTDYTFFLEDSYRGYHVALLQTEH